MSKPSLTEYVALGKIGAAHGIKGWVKLFSFADPLDNILNYQSFMVADGNGFKELEIDQSRPQGKGFVGHIKGCDDRGLTRLYTGKELLIEKALLPALESEGYYWHQLIGLKVVTAQANISGSNAVDSGEELGIVHHLLETGANDVLVIEATESSIDDQERLIPYLVGSVVTKVDLSAGLILVNWEKDY